MAKSRRNYYRILYLQPEAPAEVIRAAYRALMQTLKAHPDLGGDHERAAMINEAYSVLKDPERKAAYDRSLAPMIRRARGSAQVGLRSVFSRRDAPAPHPPRQSTAPRADACGFCQEAHPSKIDHDTRCGRCKSPLARPPKLNLGRELIGRRSAARSAKDSTINVQLAWHGSVCRGQLRDVSLTGMSLTLPVGLPSNQVIRVFDPDFEALVVVVNSRAHLGHYVIHAKLMTMLPKRLAGVFVRTAA